MHPLRKLREAGPLTAEQILPLLAEAVVFNSPLLSEPIQGRDAVARAIVASALNHEGVGDHVLEQKLDERTTFVRWKGTVEGEAFEGLELLVDGPDGLLVERTVAYRPFPPLTSLHDKIRAAFGDPSRPAGRE